MGRHGVRQKLWPSILGLVAAMMCIIAFFILVLGYPQWHP
jgi:hypothetical protein